jgi:molecular chaperone DnaK (HSP70)
MVEKSAPQPAIGIDLGTTNTCVCVFDNNKVETIYNMFGLPTTASVVVFKGDKIITGEEAKTNDVNAKEEEHILNSIFNAKRFIGRKKSEATV